MAIALSIFGVTFAAMCIWLGVRTINRKEHWAKRLLAIQLYYHVETDPDELDYIATFDGG